MWPAVPSVNGAAVIGGDYRNRRSLSALRCAAGSAARTAVAAGPSSSSVSVRGSSRTRPSWMRPISGGSASRRACGQLDGVARALERDRRALELEQRQCAAADLGDRPSRLRGRPDRSASACALALRVASVTSSIASTGISRRARSGRGRASASPRAPRATACRSAALGPAGAGGRRRPRRAADQQPGLRTAEQLVARAADERGAGRDRALQRRLVRERGDPVTRRPARPSPTSSITGTPSSHSASIETSSTNPRERKFDGWTRRIARRRLFGGGQRALVVAEPRAVRGPDLDHRRAGLRDHLGDPEAAADLDQLAARDDDRLAGAGQRGDRQQHRRGAVVDDDRILRTGQLPEDAPRRASGGCRARPCRGSARGSSSPRPLGRPRRERHRSAGRGRGSCGRSRRSR